MKIQLETKYTWKDVEVGDGFPVDEAMRFIAEIHPYLIGQTLNQVLINGFYFCNGKVLRKETYAEWEKRVQQAAHVTYNYMQWEGPLIFLIGENQLEIDLWQPDRYELSLNKLDVTLVKETKGIPLKSYVDNAYPHNRQEFYDITCLYEKEAIGQKVISIDAVSGKYDDDMEFLADINIVLENGVKFVVRDMLDSASITVVSGDSADRYVKAD